MHPDLFAHHSARQKPLPVVRHTAWARPDRVPIQAKPVGSSGPYETIGWADPGSITLGFDGSRSDDGVMVTTTRSPGGEVSFTVGDETHLFRREFLRKLYPTKSGTIHVTPTLKKEHTMDRTDIIQSRLRELEAELADIKRFGEDTYDEGAVITFKGDFGGEKTYAYAAIKAGGKWHLTGGKAIQHATWPQLVDFMLGAKVRKVRLVTGTERIV